MTDWDSPWNTSTTRRGRSGHPDPDQRDDLPPWAVIGLVAIVQLADLAGMAAIAVYALAG